MGYAYGGVTGAMKRYPARVWAFLILGKNLASEALVARVLEAFGAAGVEPRSTSYKGCPGRLWVADLR